MVEIWLDSADINEMIRLAPKVSGFTTNPTLMRKANVHDYKSWAKIVLDHFPDKPVSFEVIADDFNEMERQARLLASWGKNVYVKIPITNTRGESSIPLIAKLGSEGIRINVTAVMTNSQLWEAVAYEPEIISIFCGRIEDTGQPLPYGSGTPSKSKFLWASSRAIGDYYRAIPLGYDIITLTPELVSKLDLKGKDLTQFSRETVQMFYNDAQKAGYVI